MQPGYRGLPRELDRPLTDTDIAGSYRPLPPLLPVLRDPVYARSGQPTTLRALLGSRSPFLPLPGQTPPSRKPTQRKAGPTFATWWRARRPARGGDGSDGG